MKHMFAWLLSIFPFVCNWQDNVFDKGLYKIKYITVFKMDHTGRTSHAHALHMLSFEKLYRLVSSQVACVKDLR